MQGSDHLQALNARILAARVLDADKAAALLRSICAALGDLGVNEANVSYLGSGDDGAVEEISFEPEGLEVPEQLSRILEAWVIALLPAGWEIDGGGRGWVTIDVANSRADIEHESHNIEYESYEIG